MSNPYSRTALLGDAFQRVRRISVPDLEAVTAAFVADEIDAEQLDVLIGAAVDGAAVEVPPCVLRRSTPLGYRLPPTDRPGQIIPYSSGLKLLR